MKKLSLFLAMIFAASFVMAQKNAWITQSGNYETANLTQYSGVQNNNPPNNFDNNSIYAVQSGTFNAITSSQTGGNNYLELTQSGFDNTATMVQSKLPGSLATATNTAFITTSGDRNNVTLTQDENPLDAGGYDYSINTATALFSGNHNNYILNQGMLGNGYVPVNKQTLTQSGDFNGAILNQRGMTNDSWITQSGDQNTAVLKQYDAALPGAGYDKSSNVQSGFLNKLFINQSGNPLLQEVNLTQALGGSYNEATIGQLSWGLENITISQQGVQDKVTTNQQN